MKTSSTFRLCAFCFIVGTVSQLHAQNFILTSTNLAPGSPNCLTVADVNGDGRLDLISPNATANTLLVFTNKGNGTFAPSTNYPVGASPYWVTAADVNRDGKVDLIAVLNYGDAIYKESLVVYTNNGGGIFGSNATYSVGSHPNNNYPVEVVVADLNNDGKPDLISANLFDNTLSVLTNGMIFPAPVSTPTLSIKNSGLGLLVSWPTASAGWSLQQNPNLTNKTWLPGGYSGYGVADDGTNKSLTIAPPLGNSFFRLLHP